MSATMKIIFNGERSQIDVNTLIVALGHYQSIMAAANKELGEGKKLELKINAIEKGSFIVDVSVVESLVKQIFSGESIGYIASVVTIVGAIYETYKYFKGRPIKTPEQRDEITTIFNDNNVSITNTQITNVINIYNQPSTREAISKTIEAADEDTSVEGITVEGAEGQTTSFERKDFKEYIHRSFDDIDMLPPDKTEIKEVKLTIISLSFEPGNNWTFMYDGFKIIVKVRDAALMEIIDNGERFGKGDTIEAELEITQRYNPDYRAYENKSYRILRFIKHIETPRQEKLF